MNKYDGRHQAAHESAKASGQIMNSTVNKSGANLNNNMQRSKAAGAPQTQRNGSNFANQTIGQGSTTGRSQSKLAQGLTNSVLSHNSSYAKGGSMNNKSLVSNVTAKILGEHQDKENR